MRRDVIVFFVQRRGAGSTYTLRRDVEVDGGEGVEGKSFRE